MIVSNGPVVSPNDDIVIDNAVIKLYVHRLYC